MAWMMLSVAGPVGIVVAACLPRRTIHSAIPLRCPSCQNEKLPSPEVRGEFTKFLCPCGALAVGGPTGRADKFSAEAMGHFGVAWASPEQMADCGISTRSAGDGPDGCSFQWFLRIKRPDLAVDADEKRLEWLVAQAESEYEKHYESGNRASLSEISDYIIEAIGVARRLGRIDKANDLEKRLDHIKRVIRNQGTW